MTTNTMTEMITDADITGFAEKLDAWTESLSPKEKAFLQLLVAHPEHTQAADVQGFIAVQFRASTSMTLEDLLGNRRRIRFWLEDESLFNPGTRFTFEETVG